MEKEENSVVPVHFCIEEKEIEAQYDFGACIIARGGGYMHYFAKGGLHVFVSPSYTALYETLSLVLDTSLGNEMPDDEKHQLADFVSALLFAPTFVFTNDDYMIRMFNLLMDFASEATSKAESETQKQDFEANHNFEEGMKAVEEAQNLLKELGEETPTE